MGLEGTLQIGSTQEQWITLDGARMRYLHAGSGAPLLLVHGLLGYSFSWRYTIPALAPQATVYAVDMLGAGFSERPKGLDCRLRVCAERLLRFLDAAGLASCDMLGTSHGGAVCMMAAALAPQRVRSLILVAPVNPWSGNGKMLAALVSNSLIAPRILRVAPHLKIIHSFLLERLYGDTRRIRPGTLEGYTAPLAIPGSLEYSVGILRTWQRDLRDLQSVLPSIAHIPALLLWGSQDIAVDPASAVWLQRQFQNCRTIMMEGVGHLPYEEMPDEFNRIVDGFMARNTRERCDSAALEDSVNIAGRN